MALLAGWAGAQDGSTGQGGAEDRKAFRAARATVDPVQRLAALRSFAQDYPDSALRPRATELALITMLAHFADQTPEVHALAAQEIADAPAGLERTLEEARVADALAGAEPAGADLPAAAVWATEALTAMNEETYRKETAATQRRYKLPPLGAGEVHRNFVRDRVLCLDALAHVLVQQGNAGRAEPLLAEAYRLDPLSSEANALRGELALGRHEEAVALESLERAEATGALPARWKTEAVRLYAAGHPAGGSAQGGSGQEASADAGFEREVDRVYAQIMPAVFRLPRRSVTAGGHTALLELFTGSGCLPCVAPDLAVDSLLGSYSRRDLVALEYDENIPQPDPLTSPAGERRAALYRVASTPEAFLDGVPLPVAGSARGDAENVVVGFASELEDEAAQPSPLLLTVQEKMESGRVTVSASVSLAPGAVASALPARAVVHVALLQDGLRYEGENGVRFHRMVVRAMAPDTPLRVPGGTEAVGTAAVQTVEASFDLQTVDQAQNTYLDTYERQNDRFGEIHFRTKELPVDPAQVGVAVWVQDLAGNDVLQTAFAGPAGTASSNRAGGAGGAR